MGYTAAGGLGTNLAPGRQERVICRRKGRGERRSRLHLPACGLVVLYAPLKAPKESLFSGVRKSTSFAQRGDSSLDFGLTAAFSLGTFRYLPASRCDRVDG